MPDISVKSRSFCEWMAEKAGLAAVPGSSFFKDFGDRYIRFHFAKRDETLIEAGERLLALKRRWEESGACAVDSVKA